MFFSLLLCGIWFKYEIMIMFNMYSLSCTLQAEDLLSQSIDDILEGRLISDAEEVLLRIGGDELDFPQKSFRIDPSPVIVAKNLERN